jgi:tripartite-type tricarboxylate transporter receptor subunit TctC
MRSTRTFFAFLASCALSLLPTLFAPAANAQPYPAKPITLVVPLAPGGYNDVSGRILAQKLGEILGQPVIVDNRAGAGGTVGSAYVAKAKPDGYTLGFLSSGPLSTASSLYRTMPYDSGKDFAPVSRVSVSPHVLMVSPKFPANNLAEFLDYVRKNPRKVNYGTSGVGTSPHFAGLLFSSMTGTEMVSVAYRGGSAQMTDLLGGQVDAAFSTLPEALAQLQSGKLRALGVSTARRLPFLPDLPAIAEVVPGYELLTWNGLVAPLGTPPEIIQTLNAAVHKALADPGVQAALVQRGLESGGSTPDQFADYIREQTKLYSGLVKLAGIQPE